MRLYFELSPREIEDGRQLQPIIAIPIISQGEPNTELGAWDYRQKASFDKGSTSMKDGFNKHKLRMKI